MLQMLMIIIKYVSIIGLFQIDEIEVLLILASLTPWAKYGGGTRYMVHT